MAAFANAVSWHQSQPQTPIQSPLHHSPLVLSKPRGLGFSLLIGDALVLSLVPSNTSSAMPVLLRAWAPVLQDGQSCQPVETLPAPWGHAGGTQKGS